VWTDQRVEQWRQTGQRFAVAVWAVQQLAGFLRHVADDRLYAMWWLIALRGLHRGEAAGLRWVDVDLKARVVMIGQQRLAYGHTVAVGPPKTAASRRTIALDRHTVRLLRAHRKRQLAERMAAGERWQDSGYVFTTADGTALHPDYLTRRFGRLVTDSGLPPVRLHDLRHGAACLAHAAGADLKTIQQQLGHATIAITGQVGPPHCCGGPPSGPCRRVPTHTAQASHGGGSGSSAVTSRCSSRPGRVSSPGRSSRVRGVFVDRLTAGACRGASTMGIDAPSTVGSHSRGTVQPAGP
jgi:hypothetical protein